MELIVINSSQKRIALKTSNQPTSLFFTGRISSKFWKQTAIFTFVSTKCKAYEVIWVFGAFNQPSGLFFGGLNKLF
ncbi:hypothetical protein [Maribacter sp. R86514]|uniref:hypothetical protein n=1 Tax=Maribacter sp. R86514 TaxID=3093854 RepID=UPI0037CC905E